ncbi:hypothetical protein [Escherichia coli]
MDIIVGQTGKGFTPSHCHDVVIPPPGDVGVQTLTKNSHHKPFQTNSRRYIATPAEQIIIPCLIKGAQVHVYAA